MKTYSSQKREPEYKSEPLSIREKQRRFIQLGQKDAYGKTPQDVEEYRNLKKELFSSDYVNETQFSAVDGIEINEDFKRALKLIEETSECVFITGKAGTGKSTLLKHFANNTNKR